MATSFVIRNSDSQTYGGDSGFFILAKVTDGDWKLTAAS